MPQGLTLEQLQQMGAKPKSATTPSAAPPMGQPSGQGLTLEQLQQMGAKPKTPDVTQAPVQPVQETQQPILERAKTAVKDFNIGGLKGAAGTLAGASAFGENIMKAPLRALGLPTIQEKPLGQQVEESGILKAKNTAQKVGKIAEQVGEFFIPIGGEGKALAKATEVPRAEKGLAKAGELMYDVLRPSKGEVAKFEIKRGRDLKEIASAIAQQGIKPTVEHNTLNWKNGIEKMRDLVAETHPRLQALLQRQKGEVNLGKIAASATSNLEKTFKNASELQDAKKIVDELLLPEVQRYGTTKVPLHVANDIKSGMWQVGYDAMKPMKSRIARQVGHAISDAISEQAPKLAANLNKNMSLAMDAIEVMEKSTGRVLKGGRLGQYAAGLVGSLALNKIPVVGPVLGYAGGKALQEGLAERAAIKGASKAGKLMERAAKAGLKLPMVK